MLLIISVRTTW